MKDEINDLFLSLLSYIECYDYKIANNLALKLYDIDFSLIYDIDFTKDRIDDIAIKLLLYSINTKPDITNLSAFQYVCFGLDNGISRIIDLNNYFYNIPNIGILNNLAIAYFKSGKNERALETQKIAIDNAKNDFLHYNNQRDLIYYNELIYEITTNKSINEKNKKRIIDILTSEYVYDLEAALIVSMLVDDYKYFCYNYESFNSVMAFNNEISSIFALYYEKRLCPTIEEVQKYLKPIAIYDELLYSNMP